MRSLKLLMAGAFLCSSPVHAQAAASREDRLAGVIQTAISEENIGELIKRCNSVEIEADKIEADKIETADEIIFKGPSTSVSVPAANFFAEGFAIVKYGDTFRLLDQIESAKTYPGETLGAKAHRLLVGFGDFMGALRLARNNLFMSRIERQLPKQ